MAVQRVLLEIIQNNMERHKQNVATTNNEVLQ